jgi:hypothetical protein
MKARKKILCLPSESEWNEICSPLVRCNKDLVTALFKDVKCAEIIVSEIFFLSFDLASAAAMDVRPNNGRRDARTAIRYDR